jgi:hypothetical protein
MSRDLRRVILVLAACTALLVAMFASSASAATSVMDKGKDDGTIEVCKKVKGDHKGKSFEFRIRQVDDKKVIKFSLKHDKCKDFDVEKGKYRVAETDLPKGCKVHNIKVDGPYERINVDKGVAVVKVREDKTTTVTFIDKCKKKDKD